MMITFLFPEFLAIFLAYDKELIARFIKQQL